MSTKDTIEMLHKRASGEKPAPRCTEKEFRLLRIEMEKQAFVAKALKGVLWGAPEAVGRGIGHAVKYPVWGATSAAKQGLGAVAGVGSGLLSRAAAIPFDHPFLSLAGAGMAYDLASRMREHKERGDVAGAIYPIAGQASRRY